MQQYQKPADNQQTRADGNYGEVLAGVIGTPVLPSTGRKQQLAQNLQLEVKANSNLIVGFQPLLLVVMDAEIMKVKGWIGNRGRAALIWVGWKYSNASSFTNNILGKHVLNVISWTTKMFGPHIWDQLVGTEKENL